MSASWVHPSGRRGTGYGGFDRLHSRKVDFNPGKLSPVVAPLAQIAHPVVREGRSSIARSLRSRKGLVTKEATTYWDRIRFLQQKSPRARKRAEDRQRRRQSPSTGNDSGTGGEDGCGTSNRAYSQSKPRA
jgi:hypothetical protein